MKAVRTAAVGLVFGAALLVPAGAATAAANPSGTGRPSQSCEDIGGRTPGHTATSPGAPFNEGVGTGGLHYSETSQYDVACFQLNN
ncbi:MAG: hypothetical protein QOC79_2119 [Actinomycetota bacterium]|nr:hypothetical protein [Actinomycetota bacterium]